MHIIFASDADGESSAVIVASLSLQCLCFFNSACNPVLYAILSENFKKSYTKAFKKFSNRSRSPQTSPLVLVNGTKPRDSLVLESEGDGEPTIALASHYPHLRIQVSLQRDVLFRVADGMLVFL